MNTPLTELYNHENETSERMDMLREYHGIVDRYKEGYLNVLSTDDLLCVRQAIDILKEKTDFWLTNALGTQEEFHIKKGHKYLAASVNALRDILWDVEE